MDTGLLTIVVGQIYASKLVSWSLANKFEEPPRARLMRDALTEARDIVVWVDIQVRNEAKRATAAEPEGEAGEGEMVSTGLR